MAAIGVLLLAIGSWAGWVYASTQGEYPEATRQPAADGPLEPLASSSAVAPTDRVLVVLVFDGLSARSLESVPTPNFTRLASEGAHTSAMLPAYPTLSLPN